MIMLNANDLRNFFPSERPLTIYELFKNGDHYSIDTNTKYHIGDTFKHPGGITAIITDVSETQGINVYSLKFVETSTKREILTNLKCAWYNDTELDNFVEVINSNFNFNY